MNIKSRVLDDGRHLWHITEFEIAESDDYWIKISDANDSSLFDFSDETFEIFELGFEWMTIIVIVSVLGVTLPLTYFSIKKIKKKKSLEDSFIIFAYIFSFSSIMGL